MPAALPFVPAIIGAGGSIASSLIGSSASKNASAAQLAQQQRAEQIAKAATTSGQGTATDATGAANNQLSDSLRQQLAMYSPYLQAGTDSLGTIQQLAGAGGPLDKQFSFGQGDLQSDPGYEFTLAEGQKAIQRSQAAKGNLFSSGTLKSLANYTTGTANQHFNDAFQRASSTFQTNRDTALSRVNTLQGLAGMGYGATSNGASAIGNTGSQIGGNLFRTGEFNAGLGMEGARVATGLAKDEGNSQAAGTIGSANATAGGIMGATNAASKNISDWLAMRNAGSLPKPTGTPNYSYSPNAGMQGG